MIEETLTKQEIRYTTMNSGGEVALFINTAKCETRIKAMTELFDEMLASVSNSDNENSETEEEERMRLEKDESLSTEVHSFANSLQNLEIATPPAKERKPKTRRRKKVIIQPTEFKLEISCSNFNCTHIKTPSSKKWSKLKFPESQEKSNHYCSSCTKSIKKKWCCNFCEGIYTNPSHSKGADKLSWIRCDSPKCKCWTHIECEERNGTVIKALDNNSFKYYCPSCRSLGKKNNTKVRNDYSRLRSCMKNAKKTKNKKIMQLKKFKEEEAFGFRRIKTTKKIKKEAQQFTYVYSENYQTIDKLLKQKGYNLSLRNKDILEDFCLKGK